MQNPKNYTLNVRKNRQYAFNLCICDTTGTLEDVVIGYIPETKKRVTGSHIFALMLVVEKRAKLYGVSLIDHCTDSASNSLSALIKLASPLTFTKFSQQIQFIGLK